jgi:hypothetical protein
MARGRRWVRVGLLVAVALVGIRAQAPALLVAPVGACDCMESVPTMQPYAREVVRPRNPRLRLWPIWDLGKLPAYERRARENGFDGARWNLELRKKAAANAPPLPIEQRVVGEADGRLLEIWPTVPLEPKTTYILARSGASPDAGWARNGSPAVGIEVTTSEHVDATPPTWAGAKAARYLPTGIPATTSCSVSEPIIEIDVAEAHDDETPDLALVVAVWRGTDETAQPAAMTSIVRGHVYLGRTHLCSEANFNVAKEPIRLHLRALDLAGNASAPSDVTVDISPSARSTTPAPDSEPEPPTPAGCTRACRR